MRTESERHVYPGDLRDIAVAVSRDEGGSFSAPARISEDGWAGSWWRGTKALGQRVASMREVIRAPGREVQFGDIVTIAAG